MKNLFLLLVFSFFVIHCEAAVTGYASAAEMERAIWGIKVSLQDAMVTARNSPSTTTNAFGNTSLSSLVDASGHLKVSTSGSVVAGGVSIPVSVTQGIDIPSAAGAIVRGISAFSGPLAVGVALYDISAALGFFPNNKTTPGTVSVTKTDSNACLSGCYNWATQTGLTGTSASDVCTRAGGSHLAVGVGTPSPGGACQAWYSGGWWVTITLFWPTSSRPPDTVTTMPSSLTELQNAIASSSGWPSSGPMAPAVAQAVSLGQLPSLVDSPTVSGPSSAPGPSSVTVNPDGSTTTSTVTNNYTYQGNNIDVSTTNVTSNYNPTTNTTNTTTNTTSGGGQAASDKAQKTDCDKIPDSIGCSKYGDVPTPEAIPKKSVPVTWTPVTFASPASCPAPYSGTIHVLSFVKDWSIKFDPMCDLMTLLRPLFLAVGAAAAAMLFMEGLKA